VVYTINLNSQPEVKFLSTAASAISRLFMLNLINQLVTGLIDRSDQLAQIFVLGPQLTRRVLVQFLRSIDRLPSSSSESVESGPQDS
jgi:hypothetical protein